MTVCFRCLVCCGDRVAASCGLHRHHQSKGGGPCAQPRGYMRTARVSEYCDSICGLGRGREREESKSDMMHHLSAVDQKGGYDREALVQSRGWDLTGIS